MAKFGSVRRARTYGKCAHANRDMLLSCSYVSPDLRKLFSHVEYVRSLPLFSILFFMIFVCSHMHFAVNIHLTNIINQLCSTGAKITTSNLIYRQCNNQIMTKHKKFEARECHKMVDYRDTMIAMQLSSRILIHNFYLCVLMNVQVKQVEIIQI